MLRQRLTLSWNHALERRAGEFHGDREAEYDQDLPSYPLHDYQLGWEIER